MKREDTFDPDSIGDFTDDKVCAIALPADADDDSFKDLSSFFFAFDNLNVDPNRFSRPERDCFLFRLLGFKFLQDIHGCSYKLSPQEAI
jgi:hypothetical protein